MINLASHFLCRKYPLALLQEAAALSRNIEREELLNPRARVDDEPDTDKIYLISTYHPHDNQLQKNVHKNWDILGHNQTTEQLYIHKLICGYRRPKNLHDILCKAAVTRIPEDNDVDPFYMPPAPPAVEHPIPGTQVPLRQTAMIEFVSLHDANTTHGATTSSDTTILPATTQGGTQHAGTRPKERGYSTCNTTRCRYCPLLNKSGTITSNSTGISHRTMVKVACRSSNLIYAITCKRCGKQYVGQTLKRLMDRFSDHLRSIVNGDQDKPVGKHFSQSDHQGVKDVSITVLEFIKKPPRSPAAITIRNRVERNWTHLLRTLNPQGLNLENPKEYHSHRAT